MIICNSYIQQCETEININYFAVLDIKATNSGKSRLGANRQSEPINK